MHDSGRDRTGVTLEACVPADTSEEYPGMFRPGCCLLPLVRPPPEDAVKNGIRARIHLKECLGSIVLS